MSDANTFSDYIRDLHANLGRGDALHLLQSPRLDHFITDFPEKGTNEIDRMAFNETTGRVYINATQYFGGIPQATVSDLPIKNQKSAIKNQPSLNYSDLQHYQKIIVALSETIRLMAGIDQTIASHGGGGSCEKVVEFQCDGW